VPAQPQTTSSDVRREGLRDPRRQRHDQAGQL